MTPYNPQWTEEDNKRFAEQLLELKEEIAPYKNTLVIDGYDVVLLEDVIDGHIDFYYVFHHSKNGRYESSVVGGFIPLKGRINENDYNSLARIWNINYEPKTPDQLKEAMDIINRVE